MTTYRIRETNRGQISTFDNFICETIKGSTLLLTHVLKIDMSQEQS